MTSSATYWEVEAGSLASHGGASPPTQVAPLPAYTALLSLLGRGRDLSGDNHGCPVPSL